MVKLPDILTYGWLWLIFSVMTLSCTTSDDPPSGEEEGSSISFRFTIYTEDNRKPTRTLGVWEENAVNVAERILNAADLRILFFDQSGILLKSVTPGSLEYEGSEITNDGYYTLSASFSHDYFDNFKDDANVPFQVMILANMEGIGGRYEDYVAGSTRVTDITDSFAMSSDYFPSESKGIPMYGIKNFNVPKSQLLQGPDAPVAGDIDLIRSLCKIEVADKIINSADYPDGERYPKVTDVEMISWIDKGFIRPKHDNYPQGLKEANIYPAKPTERVVKGVKTGDVYRFYSPEANAGDMRFRVTAILEPGDAPRHFETGLNPFASAIGQELVRNHIYRFNVRSLNTVADFEVTVSDWKVVTDEFELKDIVSMEPDGFLKWEYDAHDFAVSTEIYNGDREEQLSILNGTNSYATGTFHIISPKGATWKAYFIPGENGVDAFEFVDVDKNGAVIPGSQSVFAEGNVGEKGVIHVRGKGTADFYRHWAELVVEVRTIDGSVLYAPLTESMSQRFIIYRENKL